MKWIGRAKQQAEGRGRARFRWGTLPLTAVLALGLTGAAHAQLAERPVGTVISLPASDYARFLAANLVRQRSVQHLGLSQSVDGTVNTTFLTVGVTQNNSTQPASSIWIPADAALPGGSRVPAIYRRLNLFDRYVERAVEGTASSAVVHVEVDQWHSGSYAPGATRWLLVPLSLLGPSVAVNPGVTSRIAHFQTLPSGNDLQLLMLLRVDGNPLRLAGRRRELLAIPGAIVTCAGSPDLTADDALCEAIIN